MVSHINIFFTGIIHTSSIWHIIFASSYVTRCSRIKYNMIWCYRITNTVMHAHTVRHKLVHHNTYSYLNIVSRKKKNNTTRDSHIGSEFRYKANFPQYLWYFLSCFQMEYVFRERDARFYIFVYPAALYVCSLACSIRYSVALQCLRWRIKKIYSL